MFVVFKVSTTSRTTMFIQTHKRTYATPHIQTHKTHTRRHIQTHTNAQNTHMFIFIKYDLCHYSVYVCIAFLVMDESVIFAFCYNNVHENGIKETKVSKKRKEEFKTNS